MNIDFPSSPTQNQTFSAPNGVTYVYRNGAWLTSLTLGIPDALSNNFTYGRKNAAWARSVSASGDTMTGALTLVTPAGEDPSETYLQLPSLVAQTPTGDVRLEIRTGVETAQAAPQPHVYFTFRHAAEDPAWPVHPMEFLYDNVSNQVSVRFAYPPPTISGGYNLYVTDMYASSYATNRDYVDKRIAASVPWNGQWTWRAAAQTADMVADQIGLNNNTPSAATQLKIFAIDKWKIDRTYIIAALAAGDSIRINTQGNPARWLKFTVTGPATLSAGCYTIPVVAQSPLGTEPNDFNAVEVFFYRAETTRVAKTGDTMTGALCVPEGTTAAPGLAFGASGNGFSGNDDYLAYYTGGVEIWQANSSFTTSWVPFLMANGTVTNPGVRLSGENTGLFGGSGFLAVSVNNTEKLRFTATALTSTVPLVLPAGSTGAPAIQMGGDTTSGIYRNAANNVGITTSGTLRLFISGTATTSNVPLRTNDGTVAAPSYSFTNETGTGIYRPGAGQIGFGISGVNKLTLANATATLTTSLTLPANPTAALEAAPKQYVDTRVIKSGDTMTGALTIDTADSINGALVINNPGGTRGFPFFGTYPALRISSNDAAASVELSVGDGFVPGTSNMVASLSLVLTAGYGAWPVIEMEYNAIEDGVIVRMQNIPRTTSSHDAHTKDDEVTSKSYVDQRDANSPTNSGVWRWQTGVQTVGAVLDRNMGLNHDTPALATAIIVHTNSWLLQNRIQVLQQLRVGDVIRIAQNDDSTRWMNYNVTGLPTSPDGGARWSIPVVAQASIGTEPAASAFVSMFVYPVSAFPPVLDTVAGDARYVNVTGDTMSGGLILPTAVEYNRATLGFGDNLNGINGSAVDVNVIVNGNLVVNVNECALSSYLRVAAAPGSAALPGFFINNSAGTGMWGAGNPHFLAFSVQGVEKARITPSDLTVVVPLKITNTGTGDSLLVEDAASPDPSPFVIKADGKVGIGLTAPTVPLDLVGAFNLTGAITAGGDLTITRTVPQVILNTTGAAGGNRVLGAQTVGVNRWQIYLGAGAESTGNAGSNITASRHDDAGASLGTFWSVLRAGGEWGIGGVATAGIPLSITGDNLRLSTAKTPASATATGTIGQICWDTGFIYVCTAANTWKRAALATW